MCRGTALDLLQQNCAAATRIHHKDESHRGRVRNHQRPPDPDRLGFLRFMEMELSSGRFISNGTVTELGALTYALHRQQRSIASYLIDSRAYPIIRLAAVGPVKLN